jgi:hypothetical protein
MARWHLATALSALGSARLPQVRSAVSSIARSATHCTQLATSAQSTIACPHGRPA